jgi:signal transduction histidine kinase
VLADSEEAARTNQIEVVQDLPGRPLQVNADREKLQLVFANLMNNALRFTPAGGRVRLTARQSNHEVWVQITDTGIGIAHDELENIFRDFYQVENHLTRHKGGMGLGLSIARGLLKLHHGRVWAESPGVGKGSTFTIALPLADKPLQSYDDL